MNYVERKIMELQVMAVMAMTGLRNYVEEKREGASHFVEILVAIIIVIALGLVFKNAIINFIESITNTATTKATGLF